MMLLMNSVIDLRPDWLKKASSTIAIIFRFKRRLVV